VSLGDGKKKKVITNEVLNIWATTTKNNTKKNILKNNNYFHIQALKWVLKYYKETMQLPFTELTLFTDGCAAQYKCGKNCYALTELVRQIPYLQSILHIYAPTACFKTPVDGAGMFTQISHKSQNIFTITHLLYRRQC
jgi:hypothetical protein